MYNFGYLVLAIAAGIELYYGMTHVSYLSFQNKQSDHKARKYRGKSAPNIALTLK